MLVQLLLILFLNERLLLHLVYAQAPKLTFFEPDFPVASMIANFIKQSAPICNYYSYNYGGNKTSHINNWSNTC